jgi:carbamoyltransferase
MSGIPLLLSAATSSFVAHFISFPAEPAAPPARPVTTFLLGISAFYHDSAACLLGDGVVVAAAQEERFSRLKGDAGFPAAAVAWSLRQAGIAAHQLDAVVFYERPLLKLDRLLESYLALAPRGLRSFLKAAPLWLHERVHTEQRIRTALADFQGPLLYAEHHESHAASAFFPSPFRDAAVLTIDGAGEWATASIGTGRGAALELTHELHYPDSLGLLYSAFTYQAGFRVNSGEYKLMGLAPYGTPRYVARILDEVVALRDDGSFTLDQRYFDFMGGLTMTTPAFDALFDGPPRTPEAPLTQREMDYARSVQVVCETIVLRMAHTAHALTGMRNLCMAGGVALNAVANGRLVREGPFRHVWVQPAAGDAGGALGAAFLGWHRWLQQPRRLTAGSDAMHGACLGPSFAADDVARELAALGAVAVRMDDDALLARTAELLDRGAVVGWFDGAMEFGPRALGARSILADPRDPAMQKQLNLKIKFREGFRPFAPSVLAERAGELFELDAESPYMLVVAPVREEHRTRGQGVAARWGIGRLDEPRSAFPAVTHLDHSARVQTVSAARSPRFHALLRAFEARTGCPMLVNTSFNVRGEPIVCSPADAYRCFMHTAIDALVVYPFLLLRADQPGADDPAAWQRPLTPD